MRLSFVRAIALAVVIGLPAFPQGERGTITGTVTDSTGSVVTNANVTLRNVGTNIKTPTVSNAAGLYVFPALTPGSYDLSVEHPGLQGEADCEHPARHRHHRDHGHRARSGRGH